MMRRLVLFTYCLTLILPLQAVDSAPPGSDDGSQEVVSDEQPTDGYIHEESCCEFEQSDCCEPSECQTIESDPPPSRADSIPCESLKCYDDSFTEGYLQALVDLHYYEYRVRVRVCNGDAYLSHLPCNRLLADSIMTFIGDHPCVNCVYEVQGCEDDDCNTCRKPCDPCGVWLPQNTVLFAPLIADPRQISYSIAYRFDDDALDSHVTAVSFGDEFPLYRWRNCWPYEGDMQLDLEGGVWAVFATDHLSAPLLNSDWYVALSLTYAIDSWSYRLRASHISSHLGDEFLVMNPGFARVNPSREALDFFASYQFNSVLRAYGGVGSVLSYDESYEREGFYIEYGTEVRLLGCRDLCKDLYGTPFFATHIRHWKDPVKKRYDTNRTYALGYEVSKLSGVGRKLRFYFEYHEGFSLEGQFSRTPTNYLATKMSFGF